MTRRSVMAALLVSGLGGGSAWAGLPTCEDPTNTIVVNTVEDLACPAFGSDPECLISLRCAIEQANEISSGRATISFNIDEGCDASGVCVLQLTGDPLPAIVKPTTIEGRTQDDTHASSVEEIGTIGLGVPTVGAGPPVSVVPIDAPEIELTQVPGTGITTGLVVAAPQVIIRGVSIWGFGGVSAAEPFEVAANLEVDGDSEPTASLTLEDSVIGSPATNFADPRSGEDVPPDVINVYIHRSAGAAIRRSFIGFGTIGVAVVASVQNVIERSEIAGNDAWGIALAGAATIQVSVVENLIAANGFSGFDAGAVPLDPSVGQHNLRSNTIIGNGTAGGALSEDFDESTAGVQLWGTGNSVERNLVTANAGAGVQVTASSNDNVITANSIADNGDASPDGQIGIDLHIGPEVSETGTAPYVTPNNAGDGRTDFPTFTRANAVIRADAAQNRLQLSGTTVNGARVEIFVADVTALGGEEGEGERLIHAFFESTGDADGDFNIVETLPLPAGVARGTVLVATATANNETSEFSANVLVTSEADLSISVSDSPDPVAVSDPLSYAVTVANAGASDSPSQTVTITPDGSLGAYSIVGAANGFTCVGAGPVTCTRSAALAVGDSVGFTIQFTAPATAQPLSSTFTVASPENDEPTPEDNTAVVATAMTADDNLAVDISADPNPVNIDDPLEYTIVVTNPAGGGTTARATGVAVTLTFPDERTGIVTGVPDGWLCAPTGAPAGNQISCTVDQVLVGSSHTIVLSSTAPHVSGSYDVTAAATSDQTEEASDTVALVVGAGIDLGVRINDIPHSVATGALVTYAVVITNRGPDRSNGGTVTITLPVVGTLEVFDTNDCTLNGGTLTCTLGVIEATSAHTFVVVMTAPDEPGNMVITAAITPSDLDDDTFPENDQAQAVTVVTDKADLSLSLNTPTSITTGSNFSTLITIANLGVKEASNVELTYNLPAGAIFSSANAPGWTCGNAGTVVTCTRGTLASLQSTLITVIALSPPTTGQVMVSAMVESDANEDSTANNSDTATINVVSPQGTANLGVAITDAPDPVISGGTITYTVTVSNAGPDPAGQATLIVQLGAGVTFGTATGTGWTCAHDSGVVTCTNPSLATGDSVVTITATAPMGGTTVVASAAVSSLAEDSNAEDNAASTSTVVLGTADLSADLTGPASAAASSAITYTATVDNSGPNVAADVTATITVGAGATIGTITSPEWTCATAGQVITCTSAVQGVGPRTITVNVTAPAAAGTLMTTLAVTTGSSDPNAANDTDSVTTTITNPNACTTDSECGNATSGRVCDGNVCVNGCRGSGGNGCPSGQMCTSMTTGVGSCVVVNPPDAGIIDARPDAAAADARAADAGVVDAPAIDAATPDAPRPDAPVSDEGSLEGSGCSCTTGGDAGLPFGGLLLFGVVLLVTRRRRR